MGMTNYLINKLLEASVANVAFTPPETVYLSLHSTYSNATTAGTELSGNGYARQELSFSTATDGQIVATGNVSFTANGGTWDTAISSGIYDDVSAGNMLFFSKMPQKTVEDGSTIEILAENIKLRIL